MATKAILCVDDEETILESLREQLKRSFGQRYIYEAANSAEEAMEVIDELLGDSVEVLIIVSDWLMPGIRGDELLVQVHQRYPQIVTVILKGQADNAAHRSRPQRGQPLLLSPKTLDRRRSGKYNCCGARGRSVSFHSPFHLRYLKNPIFIQFRVKFREITRRTTR